MSLSLLPEHDDGGHYPPKLHLDVDRTAIISTDLPDFSVVSNVFKKKQDSEQSTAELALEKDDDDDITVEQAWDDIVQRVKFLSADHPLGSHLRATLQRDGERHGSVHVMSSLHLIQRSTIAIKLSILKLVN
ncbi:hypothetical protein Bca52824_088509 [Brassica carinata]|uniref:Uncharacterized protein n=1 Tax=Brassica carinata TaxID=52824 RepID=A0A8X7TPN1_BRACI|nr:hypothetical protein Bca52824_088509 [Brassica carinata]